VRCSGIILHILFFKPANKGKGVMSNGDEESPGEKGEEDHQKEISDAK
jgi:hypothetical protein